jgi:hypothetical protein
MGEGLKRVLPFSIVPENDFAVQKMNHKEFLVEHAYLRELCRPARLERKTNHGKEDKRKRLFVERHGVSFSRNHMPYRVKS